jgi:hypothetical protein
MIGIGTPIAQSSMERISLSPSAPLFLPNQSGFPKLGGGSQNTRQR